jgi:ABC-type amino acid transport system permease subunit
MMPQFTTGLDWSWLAAAPVLATIASVGTLVIEMGYPIFMNVPRTRLVWLLFTVMMHIGIGVTLGLWLFAAIMIVLSVSAYGAGYVETALAAVRASRLRSARGVPLALRNDG